MLDFNLLDDDQRRAVELCVSNERLVAIDGKAGTGKTSILQHSRAPLIDNGYRVGLCAPTGKAARRIAEATGIEALTVHKLLDYPSPGELDPKTGKPLNVNYPRRDRFNPLELDVVFVDEAAMLPRTLAEQLYAATPPGGRVRLFGDINQLPPIEEDITERDKPSPFAGIVAKCGVTLNTIHRQGEGSGIVFNGDRITQGMMPTPRDDFRMHATRDQVATLRRLLDTQDFASMNNQVIIPGKKGACGTFAINTMMQQLLNPRVNEGHKLFRHEWDKRIVVAAPGDKVIMTKNWYDLGESGIMNGTSGVVLDVGVGNELIIDFSGEVVEVPVSVTVLDHKGKEVRVNPQRDIDLAYAITTHKAQGSEWDNVAFIIDRMHSYTVHRNNFYTGITRARCSVDVIYNPSHMCYALAKEPRKPQGQGRKFS